MTTLQPEVAPMGRYTTNEACELLGISRSTLLRYSKKGLIRTYYRKANMRPFFHGSDITRLWYKMM